MKYNHTPAYPCVVFALRRESMYFRRAFPFQCAITGAPCRAQLRGTPEQTILLLETGLGTAAMEKAMRWCLSGFTLASKPYRPDFVLSLGFSGALMPTLRIGDLVLATEVMDRRGERWNTVCPQETSLGEEFRTGRLLMTTELVCDCEEKRRLGQQYDATAVDMESCVIARLCAGQEVPFACVRVISDDLHTSLSPHLVDLLRNGQVSTTRFVRKLLRHPGLLVDMWHLATHTRRAARQLLKVVPLLASLGREGNPVCR